MSMDVYKLLLWKEVFPSERVKGKIGGSADHFCCIDVSFSKRKELLFIPYEDLPLHTA